MELPYFDEEFRAWVSSSIISLPNLTRLRFPSYANRLNNVAEDANF